MMQSQYSLRDAEHTVAFGGLLAQAVELGSVLYLIGDLGAGKTTLSRGFIQGRGFEGNVKSPTYTLVEPYEMTDYTIYHFDLYRLSDPEELEFMGIRDYLQQDTICLIEWPERGTGVIPAADVLIEMQYHQQAREIFLRACSTKGEACLTELIRHYEK